jgi:hypothetical protein
MPIENLTPEEKERLDIMRTPMPMDGFSTYSPFNLDDDKLSEFVKLYSPNPKANKRLQKKFYRTNKRKGKGDAKC